MARIRTPKDQAEPAAARQARAMPDLMSVSFRDTIVEPKSWPMLALLQITNLAALRREIGTPRANDVSLDVAERVAALLPDAIVSPVGRWIIEVEGFVDGADGLNAYVDRIVTAFAEPVDLDGERHLIEIAIGAAAGPHGQIEEVRLAEEAEDALVMSRTDHVPVIRDLSSGEPTVDKVMLRRELRGAIERGEMFLQYQPKVHVRRQQIASAEALIRWRHPTLGVILPADFIPLAESSRDIDRLTLWTIAQVISDQKRLIADDHDLTIFVNISGQLLSHRRFVEQACEMIVAGKVRLGFEITETSVIREPVSAIANLNTFAAHGIEIAIDDYGAGLSSLAYLKQLPAKELKIDKMFVLQLTSSNRDPLIVRSTIDLAHALEMEVTAEGVETPAALALLSVMGCDIIQGYLISRPIEFEAFRQFLRDHKDEAMVDTARASFRLSSFRRSA
jgi:EAL domain-containing protein (putative c-di-GMP-specific phosphodiesterase class I)